MAQTPQKKTCGRPKTLDRQHTIKLAMESYWRDGLNALSVNEICRRTKISKPGLYREFGGEDGLMEAVLDHYRELVVGPLLSMISANRPFAEVLNELVFWMTQDHGTPAGCLFVKMRSSPSRLGPATSARVEAVRDEMRVAYKAWYQRALDRNEVNAKIPPDFAAYYLDTQLTTVLVQVAAGEPPGLVRAQAQLAFAGLLPA
ncbi:MAG: TetR/AcrR family transcriptional regulator [Desulfobacterales bacterium]